MKRKSSKRAVVCLLVGLGLGGASVIPFVLTFNQTVASGDFEYGIGLNNWGTRQDNSPVPAGSAPAPVVNIAKDMHLQHGGGFFGKAKYPTDYFKFYEYVNQCTKFNNDKAVFNQATAIKIKKELNTNMIYVLCGTAAASIAGLMILISLVVIFLRAKYKVNDNNPSRREIEAYYDSLEKEETYFVNYRN